MMFQVVVGSKRENYFYNEPQAVITIKTEPPQLGGT